MGKTNEGLRAYMLRHRDGDQEPCALVYARTSREARRQYHVLDDAAFIDVGVERRPEFDAYEGAGPTTTDLFLRHGWWFRCAGCGQERVTHEKDPAAVVVEDRREEGAVHCGACVARTAAA